MKLFKSLSKTAVLLCLVTSIGSQFAFAAQFECRGGEGADAVFAQLNTETNQAWIMKESSKLPSYYMTCGSAEGVILRCQEPEGRTLFLDNPKSARYAGARHTTVLTCTDVSADLDVVQVH